MSSQIDKLAKIIWDYHHLNHKIEKADCVAVLGSHDKRVAEKGAELYLKGYAPIIVFSGKFGNLPLTKGKWQNAEAVVFAEIAQKIGVPKDNILVEDKSTNTGENILFTKKILENKEIFPRKIIAVHKPYMERRTYATFKKLWPEVKIVVTSPKISFEQYPNQEISKGDVINIMVGDLQRIKLYAKKGFQIPQDIPPDVWNAYGELIKLGYTKHLLNEKWCQFYFKK